MSITFDFTKEPTELVEYIKSKGLKTTFNYEEMMHEAHHKAFTVAKVTKLDLLSDIHISLQDALKEGKPFSQWMDELKPTLKEKGWWGEVEAIDLRTGEVKNIFVGSRRLKNIYNTNMRTAYAKARYESQMDSDAQYLRYTSLLEGNRRITHRAKHGIILPKNDPWWNTNYPPNAWGCKCKAQGITGVEMKAKGLEVSQRPPNIADKDWAYNPGKVDNTEEIYKQKIDTLECKSKNAKSKKVDCGLIEEAKTSYEKDLEYLSTNALIFKEVQNLFTEPNKKIELCKSNIFGEEKKVLLSSDTVQGHLDREEITAFDYSLIPLMLEGEKRVFKQKENVFVLLKKLGRNYRLALKNIKDTDEIFATSLLFVRSYEKELKSLLKFEEKEE